MGSWFSSLESSFGPSDEAKKEALRKNQSPPPLNAIQIQKERNEKERAHRNSFKGGKRRSLRKSSCRTKKRRGTKRQIR
jgi:hypothetical protein